MTMVLCLVLGAVVLATASYTTTGLRASSSTDLRLQRLAAAEAAVWHGADELVRHGAENGCPPSSSIRLNELDATVACTSPERFRFELVGTTSDGGASSGVRAFVQVIPGTGRYQVLDYQVMG